MATQKPISTVSFNSESFLKEKLDNLYKQHIIQAYMYICHKGEDGDKDHIHLRIEPNKRIDPMDLNDLFLEYDPLNPRPRACRPFRFSKEEHWFLYAVHDPQYLKIKYKGGEKGEKLPYKWQDIRANENYDVEIAFIRAKATLDHTTSNMVSRIKEGVTPLELIEQGENVFQVNALYKSMSTNDYSRLQDAFSEMQAKYNQLYQAVNRAGFRMVFDQVTHEPILIKKEDPE